MTPDETTEERTFVLLDIQHLLRARRDEEAQHEGGDAA